MTQHIFFEPWIGKNYGTNLSIYNKKILILGDSHYCESCDDCGNSKAHPECVNFTQKVVCDYLDPNHKGAWKKTYSTFINCMFNKSTSIEERNDFFSSVAFYNYLQVAAGEDAYSAGKYDYNSESHLKAFYEVIDKVNPEIIICWGDRVWDVLPNNWGNYGNAKEGAGINVNGDVFKKYLTYPYKDGGRIMLIGVQHPCMGFASDYHNHIFSELVLNN